MWTLQYPLKMFLPFQLLFSCLVFGILVSKLIVLCPVPLMTAESPAADAALSFAAFFLQPLISSYLHYLFTSLSF